jgi:hypothetical protein
MKSVSALQALGRTGLRLWNCTERSTKLFAVEIPKPLAKP